MVDKCVSNLYEYNINQIYAGMVHIDNMKDKNLDPLRGDLEIVQYLIKKWR